MRLIVVAILRIFSPYTLNHQLSAEQYEEYENKNVTTLLKIVGWSVLILLGSAIVSAFLGYLLNSVFETFQKNQTLIYALLNQVLQIAAFILLCKILLHVLRTKLKDDFDHAILYLSIENKVNIGKVFSTGYIFIIIFMCLQFFVDLLKIFFN